MFSRMRYLLIPALLLPLVAALGAEDEKPQQNPTRAVYHRAKGEKEWSLFGYYNSKEEADKVKEHLAVTGDEVDVRPSVAPVPRSFTRAPSGKLPKAETTTMEKCRQVFKWMASQKDIAFRFPVDGCYARAQLMCERMMKNKWKPRKIWSVANGESLYAKTKNHPKGFVTWGYHVAPVLRVRDAKGGQRWYVLDPSLSNAPMTVTAWKTAQMKTASSPAPFLTVSQVGKPPVWLDKKKKPGTGYWPANDPKEGAHKHALATMKKYKPYEGKAPPKSVVRRGPGVLPRLILAAPDEN